MRLRVKVVTVHHKHHLIHAIQLRNELCRLKRSKSLASSRSVPNEAVVGRVLHLIQNLLHGIELIGAQHHQTFVTLMKHDVFANHLTKGTFIKEHCCKQTEVVEGVVILVRPIESKLVALVGVVGEIAGVYTVGDNENLYIVEQAMKRCLMVALHLVVGLAQFHPSLF